MPKKLAIALLMVIAPALLLPSCSHRLKNNATGVDPSGSQAGGLKTTFVNPPYRAQDKFSITGQAPAPRPYPQRYSSGSSSSGEPRSHRFAK